MFQLRAGVFRHSPSLLIAVMASRGGGEVWSSFVCVLVLGFRGSSLSIMVGQMLMMFLGIMVSQSMPLLAGGVAGAHERLVESKLLEWLRSDAASWHGGWHGLLLECGGLDCCVFAEDGGGSVCLKGGVALAPDPPLKRLGGLLWPMFLIGLDLVLRG